VKPNLDILREHKSRTDTPLAGVDLCRSWFTEEDLFLRVIHELSDMKRELWSEASARWDDVLNDGRTEPSVGN
jgi:hypothetical protein